MLLLWLSALWTCIVAGVAIAAVVHERNRADRILEDARDVIKQAEGYEPETRYVGVEPYQSTDAAYLRQMAEISEMPTFRWFLVECKEIILDAMRTAPPEERVAMIGALRAHEIIENRIQALRGAYDTITAAEAGNDEGEV